MVAYAARRLVLLIPTLFGVSLLIFGVLKLIPGAPALAGVDQPPASEPGAMESAGRG